jgi:hypothetical protein
MCVIVAFDAGSTIDVAAPLPVVDTTASDALTVAVIFLMDRISMRVEVTITVLV